MYLNYSKKVLRIEHGSAVYVKIDRYTGEDSRWRLVVVF